MAAVAIGQTRVWRVNDHGTVTVPASDLTHGPPGRDPAAAEARLANQFIALNRTALDPFGVESRTSIGRDGRPRLLLRAGAMVGALPLRSPVSGAVEHGLVVGPRFGWGGIGQMLAGTGARVAPEILKLPMLPRSELGVPPWVLAAVILQRLESLLQMPPRRFAEVEQIVGSPRGRVQWGEYIRGHVAVAHPERVPCVFAPLQDDHLLLGAVHATVLKQIQSLASVRSDAVIVRRLLARFEELRREVAHAAPRWEALVAPITLSASAELVEALQAMAWTRSDTGLAGLSPAGGLSWRLPMEAVFEAWVEVLVRELSRLDGGVVRTGRMRETLRPLRWLPPYAGSQRYLLPDIELQRGEQELIIFDAKYKSHWEEIDDQLWHGIRDETRESHRADLLQVLAYAATASTRRVCCVLVYPCHDATWRSLLKRGRCWHEAEVPAGGRSVRLILAAVPLAGPVQAIAQSLLLATRFDA